MDIMDLDYFINKFEAIPKDKWTANNWTDYKGKYCALGHLGAKDMKLNNECEVLLLLAPLVTGANDNRPASIYPEDNPKDRVINYLKSLK